LRQIGPEFYGYNLEPNVLTQLTEKFKQYLSCIAFILLTFRKFIRATRDVGSCRLTCAWSRVTHAVKSFG